MKSNSMFVKVMAAVLAGLMLASVLAMTIIYFLN